ncbi:MAG: SAM-dependent methyltransferase [Thermomicrobiaceae bacterium]|nr:SAM-dependent methyltransferase [Thermomicrobiaceae bacterium]
MGIAGYTPPEIDPEKPDVARIYDHVLGGVANVAVDRAAAKRLLAMTPEMSDIMRANRAVLRGAVEFVVGAGIDQLLDFEGLDLVEPGLVYVPLRRLEGPDDGPLAHPGRSRHLGGVGRTWPGGAAVSDGRRVIDGAACRRP